ncbi:MAG: VOC family protein [Gammaproteobacteria bacterium]|nr:VOC family protein [Gammaproteobacteria bacterium]
MSLTAIPTLRINDIDIARQFYSEGLGFDIDWIWCAAEGAPAFAQISHEGTRIYLTERNEAATGALVHFYVENVDDWYRKLLANSIPVDTLPHDEPWGNREMQVRDPDGNYLRFCTPVSR